MENNEKFNSQFFQEINNSINLIPDKFKPFIEEFKKLYENSPDLILLLNKFFAAIDNCIINQWVFYHEIPYDTYMRLIEESADCNIIMHDYYKNNNYNELKVLYNKYKNSVLLKQHTQTLEQAFEAFLEGKYYYLIIYALLATYDGVLDSVSNLTEGSHNFKLRFNKIEKIVASEIMDSAQLELWSFLYAFKSRSLISDKFTDFKKDVEPSGLNRDWIMHGRSTKEFTEVDCVKLFNFIFSLLYYYDLSIYEELK